eukprot:snap_masked-scaffold_44-processed-gene-0.22-mRNA-1 protein AED:0.30 eAED:0.30 QI:0/-1/0/1/-1/1/1/0/155
MVYYSGPKNVGKVVAVSGFFDPLHYGHIQYLQLAKSIANQEGKGTLWVIVNSDKQAKNKKGQAFMPCSERVKMLRSLQVVDAVMEAPDSDHTVCQALKAINPDIFAIGLDEGPEYMKEEKETCRDLNIQVICPLGARVQSSSWLIERSKKSKEGK